MTTIHLYSNYAAVCDLILPEHVYTQLHTPTPGQLHYRYQSWIAEANTGAVRAVSNPADD